MVNLIELNEAGELLRLALESAPTRDQAVARQKLEGLGTLAGGIAHDFNNLLGTILADAELAAAEVAPDSPCGEGIQKIRTVAIRASEIVRELMIYAGRNEVGLEPVDLSVLVEEMLQLLKISIPKCTILKTDLSQRLPPVLANAPQLRQVVMNLIINAAEAIGPEGGVIHVATSRVDSRSGLSGKRQPTVSKGDYVCLEVSDSGGGISEEVQARIFDPFFTTKLAGRGLGLAVVKSIVASSGGSINLRSAPGQGARFEILLPSATQAAPPNRAVAVPVQGGTGPGMTGKVLLVEDEDGLRVAIGKMLRKKGLSIVEASDGWAAMDLIRNREQEIDLILLDMNIPGASSRQVLTEARRIRPKIGIILTSAYGREAVGASFNVPQIKGFIRKPYEFADLVQLLRKALAG